MFGEDMVEDINSDLWELDLNSRFNDANRRVLINLTRDRVLNRGEDEGDEGDDGTMPCKSDVDLVTSRKGC